MKIIEGIGRLSGGGAETQVRMLSEELASSGHSVQLAYCSELGADIPILDVVTLVFLNRSKKWKWWELFSQAIELVDREKPDVIHVWLPEVITLPLAFAAWRRKVPLVTSVRRSTFKGVKGVNWLRDLVGLVPHLVSRLIVSNFPLSEEPWIVRTILKFKRSKVIPNGLDCVPRGKQSLRSPPISEGEYSPLRIVFVGRFAAQKRLDFLLKAVGQLPAGSFRLDIFGEGSQQITESMKALAIDLKIEAAVSFRGFCPDWRAQSGQFDVLVAPSLSEGMPNIVLEAMAESLLVIASDIPEMQNVIKSKQNGLLFRTLDLSDLVSCLREVSNQWPSEIVEEGRRYSLGFSREIMAQNYENTYAEVI